jgi:hypothetical protein
MKKVIVVIKDTKADHFANARVVNSESEALREFEAVIDGKYPQTSSSLLAMYPEDYDLVLLGTIDEDTGKISSAKKILAKGIDVKYQVSAKKTKEIEDE